ncbi:MAG: dethiobiotin synthase [Alphaproteobacteria bacterium]|nr:dethiobiotin synthase [Alphaproteobacteria bacterium]
MTRALFITATGTDIGKTLVACTLAHQARAQGLAVRVLKPVATGFDEMNIGETDTYNLLTAAGLPITAETLTSCTPWRFKAPLAPDMAARREGRHVDFGAALAHCRASLHPDHFTVIEGVGGTMVPLGARETVRDLIAELEVPAVLVTGSYLGAISHALTALESLLQRQITVRAIVVSESRGAPAPLSETCEAIAAHAEVPVLPLPRLAGGPRPWETAPPLLELLPS